MPHQGGKPHKMKKKSAMMKKPAKANVGTRTGGFPRKGAPKKTTKMKKKY